MEERKAKKRGVSAIKKRIQREIQGERREKKKAVRGGDQKYHNKGADMEICEFRQEKIQDN